MQGNFIVAIRVGKFMQFPSDLKLLRDSQAVEPPLTQVPSFAAPFEYLQADQIARALRAAGHKEAHVATLDGMPATTETIAENLPHVVKIQGQYFAGRNSQGKVLYTSTVAKAKFMTKAVATEICKRLIRAGFEDSQVVVNRNLITAPKSEIDQVWKTTIREMPEDEAIETGARYDV